MNKTKASAAADEILVMSSERFLEIATTALKDTPFIALNLSRTMTAFNEDGRELNLQSIIAVGFEYETLADLPSMFNKVTGTDDLLFFTNDDDTLAQMIQETFNMAPIPPSMLDNLPDVPELILDDAKPVEI